MKCKCGEELIETPMVGVYYCDKCVKDPERNLVQSMIKFRNNSERLEVQLVTAEAQLATAEAKVRADIAKTLLATKPKYLHLGSNHTDWEASYYDLKNEIALCVKAVTK